jgi:membrane protease YdiL (CAAX protease family)
VAVQPVPLLSGSITRVLARADAGPQALVLLIALVNGIGEEVFFRGALYATFRTDHAAWLTTAIYCGVTIATLNLALVAAGLVMGTIFGLERRATGGVAAPVLTHLSWSTLMLLLLPR